MLKLYNTILGRRQQKLLSESLLLEFKLLGSRKEAKPSSRKEQTINALLNLMKKNKENQLEQVTW